MYLQGIFVIFEGHDCLKKICGEVLLENPSLITETKLRKYVATVCLKMNVTG